MPSPMIHLVAAREWTAARPEYANCPDFYFGAIAPDAIHTRENWTGAEKEASHLGNHDVYAPERLEDYLKTRRSPFDVGYAAHLICDPFWGVMCKSRFSEYYDGHGNTRKDVYYPDYAAVERQIYDEELTALLNAGSAPDDHPLLTRREFEKWRTRFTESIATPASGEGGLHLMTPEFVYVFARESAKLIEDSMRRNGI